MRRFSVTADTPMHKTHLPISTWIIAAYLLTTGSKGISSLKLASLLGLQYRTTWHLTHQIRAMMLEAPDLLRGLVELDEISIGGRRRRSNRSRPPAPIALLERSEPPKPKTKAKTKAKRKRGRGGGKTMTFDCRRARRQGAHGPDRSPSSSSIGLRSQPMTFLDIQELVACKLGHIQVNHSAEARDDQRTGLRAHPKPFARKKHLDYLEQIMNMAELHESARSRFHASPPRHGLPCRTGRRPTGGARRVGWRLPVPLQSRP